MFPGLPSADCDTIAKARAELLATEWLKELCKQLGLAVPTQPQMYPSPPEAPEYLATTASTVLVKTRQGEDGSPATAFGGG